MMDTIFDLYIFASRHGVSMQDALRDAGLGPNWAHRQRNSRRVNHANLAKLRAALIRIATDSGAYKPGSIPDEVAGIREALNRIEIAAGVE